MALIFSISGLRGVVTKELTPAIIFRYARDFAAYLKPGKVIVGRDARQSGAVFRMAAIEGLNASGCEVIDLGIVPTPTVLFMVKKMKACGGIVITGSHNPIQWNALKFVSSRGKFLNQREFDAFSNQITQEKPATSQEKKIDSVRMLSNSLDDHIDTIIKTLPITAKKLKIGVDAVNGAGSIGLPKLLERTGCTVYRLNCALSPIFPRRPEPTPENIGALCQLVKENNLDLGFAVDPDADRLSIVDEKGRAIGEENTLVLATDYILRTTKGNVVTNLSTTALMEDVTRKYNCTLFRTKVGEAHVVSKMESVNAVIGGEGNGGVIYPKINFTRDALVGAAIILKLILEEKKRISEVLATYPRYHIVKKKIRLSKEQFEKKEKKILAAFQGEHDFTDGLRITGKDYWLHIRPSRTEPLIRIIGEARDKKLIKKHIRTIQSILKT
jgi:phosphomannomutase